MKRSKHTGEYPEGRPACITLAEKIRAPWQRDYLDVLSSVGGQGIRKKHVASLKRQAAKGK